MQHCLCERSRPDPHCETSADSVAPARVSEPRSRDGARPAFARLNPRFPATGNGREGREGSTGQPSAHTR
jgi:hypothetical protein